ncbi:MAG: S8/S53 family peptidase [Bacteroidales bacterium]
MKKVLLLVSALMMVFQTYGQDRTKYGVRLIQASENLVRADKSKDIQVFIYGDIPAVENLVKEVGGEINTVSKDILTAQLNFEAIEKIAVSESVKYIRLGSDLELASDKALGHVFANQVHSGLAPLEQAYTGKNVIVGIIDTGIDYNHSDFRKKDDASKSRVLYIWDQLNSYGGENPEGFNYGSEWNQEQIENSIDQEKPDVSHFDTEGHGTHVTGIAAGNRGIAPEADIIMVKASLTGSTGIVDAAKYIYAKAEELGRPCVINASLGVFMVPHDGTDPNAVMVDEMVKEKPGRAFVSSAGNFKGNNMHAHIVVKKDSPVYTWNCPVPTYSGNISIFNGVVNNSDLDNLSMSFGLDTIKYDEALDAPIPVKLVDKLDYFSLKDVKEQGGTKQLILKYTDESNAASVLFFLSDLDENRSAFQIQIVQKFKPEQSNFGMGFIRTYFKGEAELNTWCLAGLNFTDEAIEDLKDKNITIEEGFISGDENSTVTSPATGKEIIGVGAYINRDQWENSLGEIAKTKKEEVVGDMAPFSCQGPTIDNRIKPEICAPGMYVMSSLSSKFNTAPFANEMNKDKTRIVMSGTSMSGPVVAGAVALMLEQNPNLTNKEIRDKLFSSTLTDNFTGELAEPNNTWGYGKLDIFKTLSGIRVGVNEVVIDNANSILVESLYPNPAKGEVNVVLKKEFTGKLSVYNAQGIILYQKDIQSFSNNCKIKTDDFAAGVYMLNVKGENNSEILKFIKK